MKQAFGAQHTMGDHTALTIGMVRAKVKIDVMGQIYNMKRQGQSSTHNARKKSLFTCILLISQFQSG